jgi:hypothetical protein
MSSTTARAIACPYGGTFAFDSNDSSDLYTLTECAFSKGFAMTGSGSYNYDDSVFTLEVNVTGLKEGTLTYTRDSEGVAHITGMYDGEEIDLSE